tara:strand:+ start:184 stop:444 length:261 start_codon:yes stop_codon:yes gene_type:complete
VSVKSIYDDAVEFNSSLLDITAKALQSTAFVDALGKKEVADYTEFEKESLKLISGIYELLEGATITFSYKESLKKYISLVNEIEGN